MPFDISFLLCDNETMEQLKAKLNSEISEYNQSKANFENNTNKIIEITTIKGEYPIEEEVREIERLRAEAESNVADKKNCKKIRKIEEK